MHGTLRSALRPALALIAGLVLVVGTTSAFETPNGAAKNGTPFAGAPFAIPGRFEAEDFDRGGQDVAYHDNAPGNTGGAYRAEEDVDIRATGDAENQYVIFNFETGEWLSYTLDVPQEGQYDVVLRVSTTLDGAAFHIEIDGTDVSGRVSIPATGGWQHYRWIGARHVRLPAGQHVLRVVSAQQYFNFDAVRVTADEAELSSTTSAEPTEPREPETTPANVRPTARLARAAR